MGEEESKLHLSVFLTDSMPFENGTILFPLCGFVPLVWCAMASGRVCLWAPRSVPLMGNLNVQLLISNHLKIRGPLGKPVCICVVSIRLTPSVGGTIPWVA